MDKPTYRELEKRIRELEKESSARDRMETEFLEKQSLLREQNINLIRKSIDFSEITKELEDKNSDLESARLEISRENINLVRKSIELSDVMRELEDKNCELDRQNNYYKLRAEIWKVAIDKSLSEEYLVQKLLNTVGSAVNASRVAFLRYRPETQEYNTEQIWYKQEFQEPMGNTIPYNIAQYFFGRDYIELPKEITTEVKPFFKKTFNKFKIKSLLVVPFGDFKPKPDKFFTFTDCEKEREWSNLEKEVLLNLANIVSIRVEQIQSERALQEREKKYRTLTENINVGIYRSTPALKGKFLEVNPAIVNMFGYDTREQLLSTNVIDLYQNPADRKKLYEKMLIKGSIKEEELLLHKKDGTRLTCSASLVAIKDQKGKIKYYDGIIEDITERKRAQKEINMLAYAIKSISDGVVVSDMNNKVIFFNEAFNSMYGYEKDETVSRSITNIQPLNHINYLTEEIFQATLQGGWQGELTNKRKDGSEFSLYQTNSIIYDENNNPVAIISIVTDITERKKTENQIKASLKEKEILLREIHHRVKNSLQVISSLLYLQSKYLKDEDALNIFVESQNRIRSMSLVHEKLYQSKNLAQINLSDYIKDLANSLFHSYATNVNMVKLIMDIQKTVIDIETAIPCGLILNELISNALKYAFPKDLSGEIKIALKLKQSGIVELSVSDTGVGLSDHFDLSKIKSMGMRLVEALVEQVHGKMEIKKNNGTTFNIWFKAKNLSKEEE